MSYRPITDFWLLARSKTKYYGGYPAGFLERARALLGVAIHEPVLHVCAGRVRDYPYPRFALGPNDRTLDLDPTTKPDFCQDAREPFPGHHWSAILIDPPYTEEDAAHYAPGAAAFPAPDLLLRHGLDAVRPGGRVGILHYWTPRPPSIDSAGYGTRFVAVVAVMVGYNNRVRVYSVFERDGRDDLQEMRAG